MEALLLISLLMTVIFITVTIVEGGTNYNRPKKVPCRLDNGITRCVNRPVGRHLLPNKLRRKPKLRFCPFRICGPSYTPSDECPAYGLPSATAKCTASRVSSYVWSCHSKSGRLVKYPIRVPYPCKRGLCYKSVFVCSCFRVNQNKVTFKRLKDYKPDCR